MSKAGRIVAAVVLLVALGVGASATPASAHTRTCTGFWEMYTPPLAYPAFPANGGPFHLVGRCSDNTTALLTGEISGHCYNATGDGTSETHSFSSTWTGMMIFTGGVTGMLNMQADILKGQSCMPPGAQHWFGVGTLAYVH